MGAIALVVTVFWPILWPVLLAVVGGAVAIGICDTLCTTPSPDASVGTRRLPSGRGGGKLLRCADDIALARQRAEERRNDLRHR